MENEQMTDIEVNRLEHLASQLAEEKRTEEKAKVRRISIENEISKLIPGPEAGQKTITLPSGTKVVVSRGFNYQADLGAVRKASEDIDVQPPIKTTYALDVKGYEWYSKNDPDFFEILTRYVKVTPKKVSVSIKMRR
jgi:hypothetical protein